jgi:hypothetical protein
VADPQVPHLTVVTKCLWGEGHRIHVGPRGDTQKPLDVVVEVVLAAPCTPVLLRRNDGLGDLDVAVNMTPAWGN